MLIASMPFFLPALPEISLLFLACMTLLVSLFVPETNRHAWVHGLSQFTLLVTLLSLLYLLDIPRTVTFYQGFVWDQLALVLKLGIVFLSMLVFLYGYWYVKLYGLPAAEYYVLALLSVLGMMVLVSAYNLLIVFLGLELFSLPLYALVALRRNSPLCAEAAMKYFIMGALATGILLYGFSLIYGITGTLVLPDIAHHVLSMNLSVHSYALVMMVFSLAFVTVGLGFKLGVIPFHMWVPDVYEGAPMPVTIFIATVGKLAVFGLVMRVLVDALPGLSVHWRLLLMILSVLSIGLGNIAAVVQINFKRLLAYSSIAHMGYMLLGIIVATQLGYAASLFYVLTYALMTASAFGALLIMIQPNREIELITDLRGLNTEQPWLAFMILINMFALAGIPPVVGFMAKWSVIEALIKASNVGLAVFAMLFSAVGAYYYIRVVKLMYFDEPEVGVNLPTGSIGGQWLLTGNVLLVVFLGIFPVFLFKLCQWVFVVTS